MTCYNRLESIPPDVCRLSQCGSLPRSVSIDAGLTIPEADAKEEVCAVVASVKQDFEFLCGLRKVLSRLLIKGWAWRMFVERELIVTNTTR